MEDAKPRRKTKTFSAYVEEWLTVYKAQSPESPTMQGYRSMMQMDPTASRKLVIPSTRKTEREAISMEKFQDILANLCQLQTQDRRLMALLMLTGMRRGEALGLQWTDIDWREGLISVRRNVAFAGNQPHIGTPKTEKGTRQIPLWGCCASTWSLSGKGRSSSSAATNRSRK